MLLKKLSEKRKKVIKIWLWNFKGLALQAIGFYSAFFTHNTLFIDMLMSRTMSKCDKVINTVERKMSNCIMKAANRCMILFFFFFWGLVNIFAQYLKVIFAHAQLIQFSLLFFVTSKS